MYVDAELGDNAAPDLPGSLKSCATWFSCVTPECLKTSVEDSVSDFCNSIEAKKIASAEEFVTLLRQLVSSVGERLSFSWEPGRKRSHSFYIQELLGPADGRSSRILGILNRVNEFIVMNAPDSTLELRKYVVTEIPKFLLEYQALRFPEIIDPSCVSLPLKRDLSLFPEVIYETGLFIPVSACLRLIAVSLSDSSAKQVLVGNPESIKSIVSHMVDDPLNPYQRESAVFLVKVLTSDFPPAQEALAKCMTPVGPLV